MQTNLTNINSNPNPSIPSIPSMPSIPSTDVNASSTHPAYFSSSMKMEINSVSLTEAQRELLEKNKVPKEIRRLLANWLDNKEGSENNQKKPSLDFLLLLSDLLIVAEKHLEIKRLELNSRVGGTTGFIAPSESPPEILSLEETIKEAWHTATALWRVADEIIRDPEPYGIHITREHARYLIATKNLTVLEMIRTSYLDYFDWPEHIMIRQLAWLFSGVGGALCGLIGGLLGGLKAGFQEHGISKIIFPLDALMATFIGWANGAVMGARLGYRTGSIYQGCRLAFLGAYLNPFRAPKGSKQRQAVELKIEETVFNMSAKWERKHKKRMIV